MFYTYILYSNKLNSFYKGETGNIIDRLDRHNRGYEIATQLGVPWTTFANRFFYHHFSLPTLVNEMNFDLAN